MKLRDFIRENADHKRHAAFAKGREAADHWLATHGQHSGATQPNNPYKEKTDDYNAWREGFKHGLHSTPWADGD